MKVAVIHDWLVSFAGAEKVLADILGLYPQADIFTLVDFMPEPQRRFLAGRKITVSFIQKLWRAKTSFRIYSLLLPFAIEKFDLSKYDLVISSSHAIAKGVIVHPHQKHICYCHTPIRYAWDMQGQYLEEYKTRPFANFLIMYLLYKIRIWDLRSINTIDLFIANSKFVASRIKRYYNRESQVIYPGVASDKFTLSETRKSYYITASRLVPYKKIDLIVEAFNQTPERELIVIGDGPRLKHLQKSANANVKLLGYQNDQVLIECIQQAKAFIFAAEEDFGIIPVEAQLCGTPVIAYAKGGALETVKGLSDTEANPTGVFYLEQSVESLNQAVAIFEENSDKFVPEKIRQHALQFSTEKFKTDFLQSVMNCTNQIR